MSYFQNLLEKKIFPLPREKEHLNYIIERMTAFMHNNPLDISETIVGGSYGKNTMIRGRAEVDLVYVLTPQGFSRAYDDLIDHLVDLALRDFSQNDIKETKFGCSINYRGVTADILIAQSFDSPLIFLNQPSARTYKPYRIVLQKEFAISRGIIYQNSVRILKYWRDLGILAKWPQLQSLKSFLLELLAAEIYDQSNNQTSYSSLLREFFTHVDEILTNENQIYFEDFYSSDNARSFSDWTVNDPADPSYNVVPYDLHFESFQNYCRYSKNQADNNKWQEIFFFG